MTKAATSVRLRFAARLTSAACVVMALLVARATYASACDYAQGVHFVGFRGTMTADSQGVGDTYDVDFVVTEVFQGTVPRHVKVRFVPAAHLD